MSRKKLASGPVAVTAGKTFSRAKAVAKRLGVHPKTVLRLADQGLLHRHKILPKIVLFDDAEIDAFIAASRVA